MKYSEFREYLKINEIHVQEDKERIITAHQFEISKVEEHSIIFLIDILEYPYDFQLLKKVIELAETPLDKRVEVKKYYLKHRYINNWGNDKYLNYVEGNYVTLKVKCQNPNYKTKFTKAEIEELKVEFDTDFNDFEFIEVEED